MKKDTPFFIGWEGKPPAGLMRFQRSLFIAALVLGLAIIGSVAAFQRNIGSGSWDFTVRDFTGILVNEPAPFLIGSEVGDPEEKVRTWYLVSELKYGFPVEFGEANHLRQINLKATVIEDEHASMLEVVTGSLSVPGNPAAHRTPLQPDSEPEEVTVRGEIVDSKCHFGVMNPGAGKTHRACAIICLRGGIPPVLVAPDFSGQTAYFLLTGPNGEPWHEEVLDVVADPVEVKGTLTRQGAIHVIAVSELARLQN